MGFFVRSTQSPSIYRHYTPPNSVGPPNSAAPRNRAIAFNRLQPPPAYDGAIASLSITSYTPFNRLLYACQSFPLLADAASIQPRGYLDLDVGEVICAGLLLFDVDAWVERVYVLVWQDQRQVCTPTQMTCVEGTGDCIDA
ncbi:uncharacterized protein SCHCODRAFT_02208374 [Schizophyllum commune H4-8]|uniref:uncharacterized protein n=1 Tax=Schizophyllum commune (strain H4-8 / FGSC 9210) TaxID=578458 RepID=UPI00215F912D|nr:uncharacterized protein SCHCODRAFT_02208374 [Schizophyllum commune H4-8]KAI5897216.1 hypothetical protein SCHCODRAFT_02208374 [Schizophyllum commune H4-8]